MTKTTAPKSTPSPAGEPTQSPNTVSYEQARGDFFAAALTMSWQLALVVLIPILCGVQLDKALGSAPACVLVGFFIAMGGTAAVVWRQLQQLSPASKVVKK